MSRNPSNAGGNSGFRGLRDYGATSSTSGGLMAGTSNMHGAAGNDVTFAGFSPTEFISLSENIAQNVASVKSSQHHLEKILKNIGGPKDSAALRDKARQIQTSANDKIITTKKDLQRLTVVVRHGDQQRKLHVKKLTSDFQKVVELYSASQQQIAAKLKGILLVNASQQDDINNESHTNSDTDYLFHQQQKQMQQNLQFEQSMLREREQRVRQIEEVVLDVNDIMRNLNSLIDAQGENIDTIENSIDHAADDVEAGRAELIKAAEYQAKYRRKVAILLIIAVIIGLIVTGLVVSQLKS